MKLFLISSIILLALATYLFSGQSLPKLQQSEDNEKEIYEQYKIWKQEHYMRKYSVVESENYRFSVFKENYLFIIEHNSKNTGLVLGLTPYTGLSTEEYQEIILMNDYQTNKYSYVKQLDPTTVYKNTSSPLPDVVDWKSQGAVTSVIDQGQCQACWAISSAEALEGLNFIQNQELKQFSAQQLIDCSKWNLGCNGGNAVSALLYTQQHGIQSSKTYPYTSGTSGKQGSCQYNKDDVEFYNKEVWQITPRDPFFLSYAVVNQPVSVLIDASGKYFQNYKSGIIDKSQCGTSINHAVLLVGYNDEDVKQHYWSIKNSFGTKWGEDGFAKIQKNDLLGKGACGILLDSTIPSQDLL